jgi:hypothetical protein
MLQHVTDSLAREWANISHDHIFPELNDMINKISEAQIKSKYESFLLSNAFRFEINMPDDLSAPIPNVLR